MLTFDMMSGRRSISGAMNISVKIAGINDPRQHDPRQYYSSMRQYCMTSILAQRTDGVPIRVDVVILAMVSCWCFHSY
jgi:hypothetical protein